LNVMMELGLKNIATELVICMKSLITAFPNGEGVILKCADNQCQMIGSGGRRNWWSRGSIIGVQYMSPLGALSLITVARVHSKSQPCSSNQCDTACLESKLSLVVQTMFISNHEIEHSFSNEAQRLVYRRLRRRTKRRLRDMRSVADSHLVHSSTLIPLISLILSQLSK
jgi:hypothetical protein